MFRGNNPDSVFFFFFFFFMSSLTTSTNLLLLTSVKVGQTKNKHRTYIWLIRKYKYISVFSSAEENDQNLMFGLNWHRLDFVVSAGCFNYKEVL